MHIHSKFYRLFVAISVLAAAGGAARADQRKFTYSYETTTAPKGTIEIENWVTWKHRSTDAGDVDRFDFRHELEFGLTDRLQLGLYLADWRYEDTPFGSEAKYLHSGVELIYNLTNPTTDWLGSALYGEVLVGEDVWELEGKLLLQKNVGPVIFVYNAVIEAEWEREAGEWEKEGKFAQTAGASYAVTRNLSVGVEALHEIELPDWSEQEDSVVSVGPNVSVSAGGAFATLTALWQVTDIDSQPDFQVRTIFGFQF